MTTPGPHEAARIPAAPLAEALGVDSQVAMSVLALPPEDAAENLAIVYAEHETRHGNRYSAEEALNTLTVLGEQVDWAQQEPEERVAAAAFALRLLGKLGITRFDMGAA